MSKYSIHQFIQKSRQEDKGQGLFELETERILEVNLNGDIWTKMGSMISYEGSIKFQREGMLEHGLGKLMKKALTGEGSQLMKASGNGKLYIADQGKKITILDLEGDSIYINGNDLLAFEKGLEWDIKLMRKVAGMMAGGLFNVRLEGRGMVAFTSHYEPLTLMVNPGQPVYTDPNATVAWSGNLQPEFVTDVQLKTFLGRGSGESIQMKFAGNGFVVVQPFEEVYTTGE
ncbi:AIM24 family protein [Sutcliffiella horikoshii]|uniref:AIM24 family protein n=1 Tax=Sutcliffiella horikoshii TaxID=79883 RepID=A0A5D4T1Z8_9BACI|nr:AIM24 family protein [Sutcliffiella horikoshii]TYS68482.1 AIM24 family protein [Sutcliffiella horikoshii]